MKVARAIVHGQKSRVYDKFGSGQFGVSRDHGSRSHRGIDVVTRPREAVFAPIDGVLTREALPYKNDLSLRGILIKGTGAWDGYEVKIFYADGLLSGPVKAGQHVAFAQDLSNKYPGITNHVHVEVRCGGVVVSPQQIFAQCF